MHASEKHGDIRNESIEILSKVKDLTEKDFDIEPAHNDQNLITKIKSYTDEIQNRITNDG